MPLTRRPLIGLLVGLVLGATVPAAAQDSRPLRPGDPAPAFTLPDLDGKPHRLEDYRGRVVVLEWTSHLCPSVQGWHDGGQVRAAMDKAAAAGAAWLAIDSGFFAAHITDGTRAWRVAHNLSGPCLIDASGEVGRRYGATNTPHFFVIDPQGALVYKGLLSDWNPRREGSGKSQYVLDAVAAAAKGPKPAPAQTSPQGCSVKYTDKPLTADKLAAEIFDWAAGYADEEMIDGSFDLLRAALKAGYPRPSQALTDPRFHPLRAAATRPRLRDILREFPVESSLTVAPKDEPGEALIVSAVVRDAAGAPVEGAAVYLYHTDRAGLYSEGGMDESNPRLFAFARTDAKGRFEYRTIRPGHYPDSGEEPVEQHVHYEVSAAGFKGMNWRLGFRDDPFWEREKREPPRWAAPVARGPGSVDRCEHEIRLERE